MPRLNVYAVRTLELQLELGDLPVHIGRTKSCQICLNDPKVSREHAQIVQEDGRYVLKNLSQYGTRVNSHLVKESCPLEYGDRIYFGERYAILFMEDGEAIDAERTIHPGF
jgi:pSer/pThr/pTyr-binding forkhead associated (FHA) protein